MEMVCPICSEKEGQLNRSGLYKHKQEKSEFWVIICFNCGWETEPFYHHNDIKLPTKSELRGNWR